jgi:hypothetical protein
MAGSTPKQPLYHDMFKGVKERVLCRACGFGPDWMTYWLLWRKAGIRHWQYCVFCGSEFSLWD